MGTLEALNSSSNLDQPSFSSDLLLLRIGSEDSPPQMTYEYNTEEDALNKSSDNLEILREDSIVNNSVQELSLDTSDLLFLAKSNQCTHTTETNADNDDAPVTEEYSPCSVGSDLEEVLGDCDLLSQKPDSLSDGDEILLKDSSSYHYGYKSTVVPCDNSFGSLISPQISQCNQKESRSKSKPKSSSSSSSFTEDEEELGQEEVEEDEVFLPHKSQVRYSQICNAPLVAEEPELTSSSSSDVSSVATTTAAPPSSNTVSSSSISAGAEPQIKTEEESGLLRAAASSSVSSISDTFVKPCDLVIKVNNSCHDDDSLMLAPSSSSSSSCYEKKYKSTSEISRHLASSSNLSTSSHLAPGDSSLLPSPSSKSVKSLSALSPSGGGFLHRSWYSSISRMSGMKKLKKKSLTSMFDAMHEGSGNKGGNSRATKSDYNLKSSRVNGLPPRANSTTAATVAHKNGHNTSLLNTSSQTNARLATSDLRNVQMLERRCQSIDRGEEKLISSDEENEEQQQQQKRKVSPHPQVYFTVDSRRQPNRHTKKYSLRDKKLLYGIKQFNLEPKRGLEVLETSAFLPSNDPKAVAQFLFREGRLSKKQIGKYIGGHETSNKEVLRHFVRCHEFTHLILVQALRQFLWSFRLPGEAMQIDRIMEAFAERYCEQNPLLFEKRDTCYILSFSIIMLNTALHNPNVKQKITVEQFIKQNRGINSGKDLPKDILDLIYRSIKEEPFKIPDETYDDLMYTFFSPEKEGWLMKQGGSWKNWKRRWFVLSDRCLYYFQHTAENVPKGIIPLENIKVRPLEDTDGKSYCFELYSESNNVVKGCKTDSKGTVVQGNHKSYRMSANSAQERLYWLQCLQNSIREHPFHDIITAKKRALRRHEAAAHHNNNNSSVKPAAAPTGTPTTASSTPAKPPRHSLLQQGNGGGGTPFKHLQQHHLTSTPKTSTPVKKNNTDTTVEDQGDKLI